MIVMFITMFIFTYSSVENVIKPLSVAFTTNTYKYSDKIYLSYTCSYQHIFFTEDVSLRPLLLPIAWVFSILCYFHLLNYEIIYLSSFYITRRLLSSIYDFVHIQRIILVSGSNVLVIILTNSVLTRFFTNIKCLQKRKYSDSESIDMAYAVNLSNAFF